MKRIFPIVLALVCLACCLICGVSAAEVTEPAETTVQTEPVTVTEPATATEPVQEVVPQVDRPFMTTRLDDYTVSEGLLLLIFVTLLIMMLLKLFWR